MSEMTYGQVVISKAGRDKGQYFIVVDIHEDYVLLADGSTRRLDHLKKKKVKHIQPTNDIAGDIGQKIRKQLKLTNLEIRQVLESYNKPQQNI